MAKLNAKARKALPKADFAGPNRSYPIPDANHARAAIVDAARAVKAGRMSKATEQRIDAKADAVLNRSRKGK